MPIAVVCAGVEQFFGQDPLVPFDLAVVPGRVGPGPLVAASLADDEFEVSRAVASAVVGDDAVDAGDAVIGEPGFGAGEERSGGGAFPIGQGLGAGQA